MNPRNLALGVFVTLTIAFASLTLAEYNQISKLNSLIESQSRSTSTQTLTLTVVCPSNATCASFSYSPTGQLVVESVEAHINGSQVSFFVTVENSGVSPVYLETSTGGISTSLSSNSTALEQQSNGEFCPGGTVGFVELDPGQNFTFSAPTYCDGFSYVLVGPGTAYTTFSFNWELTFNGFGPGSFPMTTEISGTFDFESPQT